MSLLIYDIETVIVSDVLTHGIDGWSRRRLCRVSPDVPIEAIARGHYELMPDVRSIHGAITVADDLIGEIDSSRWVESRAHSLRIPQIDPQDGVIDHSGVVPEPIVIAQDIQTTACLERG